MLVITIILQTRIFPELTATDGTFTANNGVLQFYSYIDNSNASSLQPASYFTNFITTSSSYPEYPTNNKEYYISDICANNINLMENKNGIPTPLTQA